MNSIIFLNQEYIWIILTGGLLLWLLFTAKEWFGGKRRKILKSSVALLAVVSLLLLALKPARMLNVERGAGVLLTENVNQYQLDSLLDIKPQLPVYNYAEENDLISKLDSLNEIYLLGSGMEEFDLWMLADKNVYFLGSDTLKGITHLKYDTKPYVDEKWVVTGTYKNASKGNRLVLQQPGGSGVDSVRLSGEFIHNFQLSAALKSPGNFLYKLIEKDSLGSLINEEAIPVVIDSKPLLNILVINDFPTFETKYLKNFLAENGHEVLVRTKLTRGKFKYEYFNRKSRIIQALDRNNLSEFDLLILDNQSVNNFSRSVLDHLKNAVALDGLGIFIQADDSYFRSSSSPFYLQNTRTTSSRSFLTDYPNTKLDRYPYAFKESLSTVPVLEDHLGSVMSYTRINKGRVGASVLTDIYQLLLNGNDDVYRYIWSKTLEALSKPKDTDSSLEVLQQIPVVDQPVDLKLFSILKAPNIQSTLGKSVPLAQEFLLGEQWNAKVYPRNVGWQYLKEARDTGRSFPYYVYDTSAWKSVRHLNLLEINTREFSSQNSHKSSQKLEPVAIQPWWFFAIFLISVAFLWVEPKL